MVAPVNVAILPLATTLVLCALDKLGVKVAWSMYASCRPMLI